MRGKTVLITGANGGLGSALVEQIAKDEPKKIYCGVRDVKNSEFLKSFAQNIELLELDISNKNSIKQAISNIDELDILINNAGINLGGRVNSDDFSEIEVNLFGTINLTQALFAKLSHSGAKVINITSSLSLINLPTMANYCISKAALRSYTQALRAELAIFGAKVFEALSGPIDTRLTAGVDMPKASPQDVASAIVAGAKKDNFEIYTDDFAINLKKELDKDYTSVEMGMMQSIKG